jgi:phosphotransferase system HPr (HPr) family protein
VRSIEVEVRNKEGLHARPAAAFVLAATGFASTIRITNLTAARPEANARSITGVLAIGAEKGHTVKITANGPDEAEAIEMLQGLLAGPGEPVGE